MSRARSCAIAVALALALSGAVALSGASACTEAPRAPPRPFGVPSTAAWAGGADGGAWIDCWRASDVQRAEDGKPHPELDATFDCSIFDERGAIQKKGRFHLKPATDPRRVMRYAGWDGVRILLDDKRTLE